jgi:hypothetical protein
MNEKKFIPTIEVIYPENEKGKLQDLKALFEQWYKYARGLKFIKVNNKDYTADDFIYDGFFPNYFNQKIRILYIGREAREIDDDNYIESFYNAWVCERKKVSNDFHKRMLFLTWAINNNFPDGLSELDEWKSIPEAEIIADSFSKPNGISFAFMNLSKFINYDKNFQANMELIDSFLESAIDKNNNRNFLNDEIKILEPDLIITMNLSDLEGRLTKYIGVKPPISHSGILSIFEFDKGKEKIPLFDTFHFSAKQKNDITELYEPIKKAWKEHLNKKRSNLL